MNCKNKITHTVQEGDSLYKLARQYRTTVTELILGNSGVNPYNLQIGMKLTVCPGEEYEEPEMPGRPGNGMMPGRPGRPGNEMRPGRPGNGMMPEVPGNGMRPGMPEVPGNGMMPEVPGNGMMPGMPEVPENGANPEEPGNNMTPETPGQQENAVRKLMEEMRLAWLSNIYWTRMYMMSIDADNADQQDVFERMLQTADEIVDVFAPFLSTTMTRQLQNLLMEHVELTGQLIRTLKSGQMEDYDSLIRDWYGNANQIALLLEGQNPYFGSRETRNLLLNHLDMTREAIEYQFNGDYGRSIDTFRDIKNQVLNMADYFSRGLLAR